MLQQTPVCPLFIVTFLINPFLLFHGKLYWCPILLLFFFLMQNNYFNLMCQKFSVLLSLFCQNIICFHSCLSLKKTYCENLFTLSSYVTQYYNRDTNEIRVMFILYCVMLYHVDWYGFLNLYMIYFVVLLYVLLSLHVILQFMFIGRFTFYDKIHIFLRPFVRPPARPSVRPSGWHLSVPSL